MKIALIGYGQMGQQVEKAALRRGHTIVARLTSQHWDRDALQSADICIEFSRPESALDNVRQIAALKKNLIIGATGWYDRLPELESIVTQQGIGVLYGANFSLGVHLLMEILAHASKVIAPFEEYDVAGIEYHHNQKKDRPSGTALEIAKAVSSHMPHRDDLHFESVRCGSIPGTHTVLFDSPCDSITITHTARNREGFAEGAVRAAEWLQNKTGLYTFQDCVSSISQRRS